MGAQTISKERSQTVSTPDKPPYQTPVVLPLGGIPRGYGQSCATGGVANNNCNPGTTASGNQCHNGNTASGNRCNNGSTAANGGCDYGSTAGTACSTGTSAGLS